MGWESGRTTMNYGRFIYKNAFRNKRRTALTILSIGFSLLLLITLQTFLDSLINPPVTEGSVLRVAVRRSTSLADQLPYSYQGKLEQISNVAMVMPLQWFGGQYIEPKNFFPNFGCDQEKLWDLFPEYIATDETKANFKSERMATVVGKSLMERFGWKDGDRITLKGTIFPVDLELKIAGSFTSPVRDDLLYFRMDYMNEALGKPNKVGTFWIKARNPESVPGIIETVDKTFRNTPAETKTETEKAFQLGFVSMLGNVRVLIGTIASVVVFTMLLVAASTMAMTIRERIREVAILKSLGYTRRILLSLMMGEAVFVALLGTLAATLGAYLMSSLDFAKLTMGFIRRFDVAPSTVLFALSIGLFIGVFSGLFPALRASKLKITEAMRRLE